MDLENLTMSQCGFERVQKTEVYVELRSCSLLGRDGGRHRGGPEW